MADSWRDEAAKRLDALCALTPEALGFVNGVPPKINRAPLAFWKNSAQLNANAPASESKDDAHG